MTFIGYKQTDRQAKFIYNKWDIRWEPENSELRKQANLTSDLTSYYVKLFALKQNQIYLIVAKRFKRFMQADSLEYESDKQKVLLD